MSTYNILNGYSPEEYNLLIPVQSLQDINSIYKYVPNIVHISTNLQDKEIYLEKSAGQNMYALTHKALMKLCNAGNGQIVEIRKIQPRVCEKCIEMAKSTRVAAKCGSCDSRYNVAVQVIMKFPELSGGWKIVQASREIDVSMIAKAGQADKVKEFANEHAESKAISRCIRKAFSIKSAYTMAELEKPFIAVYPVLDAKDPDVKKALIAGSMAASNLLYGSGLQIGDGGKIQALPEAKAVEDDYEVESVGAEQQEGLDAPPEEPERFFCGNPDCGTEIQANVADYSKKRYRMPLCVKCQQIAEKKKKEKEAGK